MRQDSEEQSTLTERAILRDESDASWAPRDLELADDFNSAGAPISTQHRLRRLVRVVCKAFAAAACLLFVLYVYIDRQAALLKSADPNLELIRAKLITFPAMQRWGFYLIHNGEVFDNFVGSDGITGVWAGGDPDVLTSKFVEYSRDGKAQDKYFVIFKADTCNVFQRQTQTIMENELFQLGVRVFAVSGSSKRFLHNKAIKLLPTANCREYESKLEIKSDLDLPDKPWKDKIPRAVWRGATSGIYHSHEQDHCQAQFSFCATAPNHPDGLRARIVKALHARTDIADVGFVEGHGDLAKGWEDIPVGLNRMSAAQQSEYKIVFAMDGWGFPGSFRWELESGSIMVLVSELQSGNMHKHMKHGENCFIASPDGSDIVSVVETILALPPAEAERIIANALRTAADVFTPERLSADLRALMHE